MNIDVIITGFTKWENGNIASIVLAMYDEEHRLTEIGKARVGFNDKDIINIFARLHAYSSPHFPGKLRSVSAEEIFWVNPVLVCEVNAKGWTDDLQLYEPVFLRLKDEKNAGRIYMNFQKKSRKIQ